MVDVTLGVFWDRGSRSLYKNVMFCTFFRLRNSQAKACGHLKEICNVGVKLRSKWLKFFTTNPPSPSYGEAGTPRLKDNI
jgi:hypothetical protein